MQLFQLIPKYIYIELLEMRMMDLLKAVTLKSEGHITKRNKMCSCIRIILKSFWHQLPNRLRGESVYLCFYIYSVLASKTVSLIFSVATGSVKLVLCSVR